MGESEPTLGEMGLDPSEMEIEQNEDKVFIGEKEITLEEGESIKFPTIEVERLHLFVGKSESGLTKIPEAEETTVGDGVYLTPQRNIAEGYALRRIEVTKGDPTVYEVEITNLTILDLTSPESLESFARYFKEHLLKLREELIDKEWSVQENAVDQALNKINSKSVLGMSDITFSFGPLVRDILSRQGFDGLKTEEGGEGRGEIGNHDSYVIFDPDAVKVVKESRM